MPHPPIRLVPLHGILRDSLTANGHRDGASHRTKPRVETHAGILGRDFI
jgi:hypothetical protein